MWLLGHTALAYLVIKLTNRSTKIKLEGRIIAMIFIFANILDATHVGYLRMWGHNPLGTLLFTAFWIFFFGFFRLVERKHYALLLMASMLHVVGDLLFSGYHLFVPFNYDRLTVYTWNSYEDLIAESLLVMFFLAVFILSNDQMEYRKFLLREKKRFLRRFSRHKILKPEHFVFEALVLYLLFALVQFLINLAVNYHELLDGVWYVWLFTILFIAFLYYTIFPLFRKA